MNNKIITKIICMFIILTIVAPSYISISESRSKINHFFNEELIPQQDLVVSSLNCYGFIVPIPSKNDITTNPQIQYETLNLINDLIRNNISVYCNLQPIELSVLNSFYNSNYQQRLFEKGSFIIPFANNCQKDMLLSIILLRYSLFNINQSNQVQFQYITEPIPLVELMQLHEPRIAYYFDEGITIECLDWYLSPMIQAGFLQCEMVSDEDIINNLTNNRYNVLVVPGGRLMEGFRKDLNLFQKINRQEMIKSFISNGGGYVGSCYGAFISSSGMRYTPFLVAQYYTKKLPSFGFLSLSDALLGLGVPSDINISIKDSDNPVLFGLNGTIPGSKLRGGPVYTWVGKHTEELASIESIDTSWFRFIDSLDNKIIKNLFHRWINFTIGKTIWISSDYDQGKIVTFGDHPEQGNILLKRAVHNSVLYVSSENSYLSIDQFFHSYSWMKSIIDKYDQYFIDVNDITELNNLYNSTIVLRDELDEISLGYESILSQFNNLSDSHLIDTNFYYTLRGGSSWEFDHFIPQLKQYLYDENESEDAADNIRMIDALLQQSSLDDLVNSQIDMFKQYMNDEISLLLGYFQSYISTQQQLYSQLVHYKNTTQQDEFIDLLLTSLNIQANMIVKNLPLLIFKSRMLARDIYYLSAVNKVL